MWQSTVEAAQAVRDTPVFRRTAMVGLAAAGYAALVVALEWWRAGEQLVLRSNLHTLFGAVLGLLLVFRTNTAYDRWWEGRKQWGQLVNDSRNLALKVQSCVRARSDEKHHFGRQLVSFALALKDHLRDQADLIRYDAFAPASQPPRHVPLYIATRLYERIEAWRQDELLGGYELLFLDRHAAGLMDVCGACERIRSSPISTSWRSFVRQCVGLYLVTLPWGLVQEFGLWTIPAVLAVAYFMVGLELIAENVEDPFGTSADDLKLDEICAAISRSVDEVLPHPAGTSTD